jgi:hypothetical protein
MLRRARPPAIRPPPSEATRKAIEPGAQAGEPEQAGRQQRVAAGPGGGLHPRRRRLARRHERLTREATVAV